LDGVTGRAILKALVAGETDPDRLAACARGSLRSKKRLLSAALEGRFGVNHRFLLDQLLAQLDHGATLIAQCDARLLELTRPLEPHLERLQTIVGIGRRSAEVIVSEIGVDMTRFASAAHLASWRGSVRAPTRVRGSGDLRLPAWGISGSARPWWNPRGPPPARTAPI